MPTVTDAVYLKNVDQRSCRAVVQAVDGTAVALDQTVLYATGGGQPHDTGTLGGHRVVDVTKSEATIWHHLAVADAGDLPAVGDEVEVALDWDRRFQLMRTHTAMHLLGGVMVSDYGVAVTGGNMEPLAGRMDFEFPVVPEGFKQRLEDRINEEVAADRPISVEFVDADAAAVDPALIRTKTNLVPKHLTTVRVVDIDGFDRQADGGTHVHRTSQVGTCRIVKVESKGKGFRRVRLVIEP